MPSEIKNKKSSEGFKQEMKNWKLIDYPCRICKIFVPNLGFM